MHQRTIGASRAAESRQGNYFTARQVAVLPVKEPSQEKNSRSAEAWRA